MSEKTMIAAMREWLKGCPLIAEEQDATGAAFRIEGLEEEATAFSIEDTPANPVLTEYISGRDMVRNYLFLSRREYGETDVLTIQNSGFFEQLADWVMEQDDCGSLPDLSGCGHGKEAQSISVASTGYIVTDGSGSCKMQMQLRLVYYQPRF